MDMHRVNCRELLQRLASVNSIRRPSEDFSRTSILRLYNNNNDNNNFNSVLLHDTLPVDLPDHMTIRHFDLSFLVLTPGVFTTWGIKNKNKNK